MVTRVQTICLVYRDLNKTRKLYSLISKINMDVEKLSFIPQLQWRCSVDNLYISYGTVLIRYHVSAGKLECHYLAMLRICMTNILLALYKVS